VEPLVALVASAGGRLQALVPRTSDSIRRAILYDTGDHPFTRYRRSEVSGPPEKIVELACDLLDSRDSANRSIEIDASVSLLLCTHGSRDRCCGSRGTQLERRLSKEIIGPETTLWRTSHTGGHRFAPTALVFPEGTGWGYLDEEILTKVLRRSGQITDVLPHYRGCAGLASPRIQALERAVLAELGWELLDRERFGTELDDGLVRLTVRQPDGDQHWTGRVEIARTLPVPGCGVAITSEGKAAPELIVRGLKAPDMATTAGT
jgi:hypothetical protein